MKIASNVISSKQIIDNLLWPSHKSFEFISSNIL